MKQLVKLTLINFKGIRMFEKSFEPGNNVWLLLADNEKGKSTVLEGIGELLGTKDSASQPIRTGQDEALIEGEFVNENGEVFKVQKFLKKGQTARIVLTLPSGVKTSKVSDLRNIFKFVDIDVDEFLRMSETAEGKRKQIELVKQLLPVDSLNEINKLEAEILREGVLRTQLWDSLNLAKALVNKKTFTIIDFEKYAERKDVLKLQQQLTSSGADNQKRIDVENRKKEREKILNGDKETNDFDTETNEKVADLDKEIKRIEKMLSDKKAEKEEYKNERSATKLDLQGKIKEAEKWLKDHPKVSNEALQKEYDEAVTHNEKVKEVEEHKANVLSMDTAEAAYNVKLDYIKSLREKREAKIKSAKLPVENLSFDEEGLLYEGLPFEKKQIATSAAKTVIVQLSMALNPETKLFRISCGENIGEKLFNQILALSKEKGFQGFVERFEYGKEEIEVQIAEEYFEELKETATKKADLFNEQSISESGAKAKAKKKTDK